VRKLHPEWDNRPVTIHELGISALIRGETKPGYWEVVMDYKVHLWTDNQVIGLLALEASWLRPERRAS
jgi:hypothetical protein